MPVAIGGGISTIEDIHDLLSVGADKVVIKSKLIENPKFVNEAANIFGDQCITLAIDVMKTEDVYYVYNRLNKTIPLVDFLNNISLLNFGEIILTSVDNDGMMNGFDIELVQLVEKLVSVPIVVSGGAGEPKHLKELFSKTNVDAVGAASIFYFTRYTPHDLKVAISSAGRPVRIVKKDFIPHN
jgi:cyclase